MKKYIWFVALIFIMAPGCNDFRSYIDIAKDKGITGDYKNILKKWTREKTVHSQFETKVRIAATYKSIEFMAGYQKEYARIYNVNHEEDKENKIATITFNPAYKEFFFYAYIPEKESNDFELQRSIWKISLINESGQKVEPVEIRKVTKITPAIEVFYPYINKYYGNCYQLKFSNQIDPQSNAINTENKPIKLVFTSVLGKVELDWN